MNRDYLVMKTEAKFKFNWTCYAAGLMHMVFLLTFLYFGMGMLAVIDCCSIMLYIAGGMMTGGTGMSKHALAWIIAIYIEILLHALFCTIIQGLEVSFFYFPLVGMPLYAYYLFMYCEKRTLIKTIIIMGIITLIVIAGSILFVENVGTVYSLTGMHTLSHVEIVTLRSINITFTFGIVMVFTVIFCIEVTQLLGRLHYIASHDPMTGLVNRRSLWSFFEGLEKSGDKYCIIMGDLDDFKKINDTYGHNCGDEVLQSVADIILDHTGDDEMACRWGGEEMVIVMRGMREECLERVNEIKSQISALDIIHDGQRVGVTMTFGFADCDEAAQNTAQEKTDSSAEPVLDTSSHLGIDLLIPIVDDRLYTGKRSGKNVVISA